MAAGIGFTKHGFERYIERVTSKVTKKDAHEKIKKVYRTGVRLQEMEEHEKRFCYLKMKNYSYKMGRIVKYDNVFFFFSKDSKCITCYAMGN